MLKRILITGGSSGIGEACVKRLAATGADVTFFYHSKADEARRIANETGARALCCDVGDDESVKVSVAEASRLMSGIDGLVLSAGISRIGLFQDMSEEEWNQLFEVNFHGMRRVIRESVPHLLQNGGSIVLIGSVWGRTGASCESAYSATKGAIRAFSMALAKELGPSRVRVNCVEPGVIDTPMNASLNDEDMAELIDSTPLGRIGKPDDVAFLVKFLMSDESSFITGQCIGVDGGFPT